MQEVSRTGPLGSSRTRHFAVWSLGGVWEQEWCWSTLSSNSVQK